MKEEEGFSQQMDRPTDKWTCDCRVTFATEKDMKKTKAKAL